MSGVKSPFNLFAATPLATVLRDHPITYVDVGCRGGFEGHLAPIAFAVDALGFEPDPTAFAVLEKTPPHGWRSVRFFPDAIAGETGSFRLHIPSDPLAASLLEPNSDYVAALNRPHYFAIERTLDVVARNLDEALADQEIEGPDYLKLDIEGVELEVLTGAPQSLSQLLAIKTEVAFHPLRQGQATAFEVGAFLRDNGFELADTLDPHRWRRDGTVLHPLLDNRPVPYSRGRLMQADFLFFRRPDHLNPADGRKLIKLASVAMAFGYFDYAATVLEAAPARDILASYPEFDAAAALAACSRTYGRRAFRHAFVAQLRGVGPFLRRFVDLFG